MIGKIRINLLRARLIIISSALPSDDGSKNIICDSAITIMTFNSVRDTKQTIRRTAYGRSHVRPCTRRKARRPLFASANYEIMDFDFSRNGKRVHCDGTKSSGCRLPTDYRPLNACVQHTITRAAKT